MTPVQALAIRPRYFLLPRPGALTSRTIFPRLIASLTLLMQGRQAQPFRQRQDRRANAALAADIWTDVHYRPRDRRRL
jgi:hypothetical protein